MFVLKIQILYFDIIYKYFDKYSSDFSLSTYTYYGQLVRKNKDIQITHITKKVVFPINYKCK